MDWFTILMIIIFFVAPVIQQILEAKKKSGAGTGEPLEDHEEAYRRIELPVPADSEGDRQRPSTEAQSWSDGWSAWPGTERSEGEDRAREETRVVVQRPASPRPPAQEVPGREVREYVLRERSLETLERRPLPAPAPQRVSIPIPVPAPTPAKVRALAIASAPRATLASPPRTHRPSSRHPQLAVLRSGHPQDLRDAIIVSEILSPPKGLREME